MGLNLIKMYIHSFFINLPTQILDLSFSSVFKQYMQQEFKTMILLPDNLNKETICEVW